MTLISWAALPTRPPITYPSTFPSSFWVMVPISSFATGLWYSSPPVMHPPRVHTCFIIKYNIADEVASLISYTCTASADIPYAVPINMLDDDAHFKLGYAPAELFFPARDAPNDNAYGSKTSADGGTNHFTKFVPGRDLVDGILCGSRAYTDAITYQFSIFVLNQDTLDNIACNYKAYADVVTIRITTFVPD